MAMIWFRCSQCGKVHGRPESAVNTLIFCECGQGNTVPWASTVPPPPEDEVLPEPPAWQKSPPPVPELLEPIPVIEEDLTSATGRQHIPEARPADQVRAVKPVVGRRRDPSKCFNHQELPAVHRCVECDERFCEHCVVQFQGSYWCGPCKNHFVRRRTAQPRTSTLALVALGGGLLAGPCSLFLSPMLIAWLFTPLYIVLIIVQLGVAGLGLAALVRIQNDQNLRGQAMALGALAASSIGVAFSITMMFFPGLDWI